MASYNVWIVNASRWTNGDHQDENRPRKLTYKEAFILGAYKIGYGASEQGITWQIRILEDDGITSGSVIQQDPDPGETTVVSNVSSVPINDYICKVCNNPRCSRTEKSCWKCGEPIKP